MQNHRLLLIGNILWIAGLCVTIGFVLFFVLTGGWGLLILASPNAIILLLAILAIAFGRYFVTKSKA